MLDLKKSLKDFLRSNMGIPLNRRPISELGMPLSTSQNALKFSISRSSLTSSVNTISDRVATVTFITYLFPIPLLKSLVEVNQ